MGLASNLRSPCKVVCTKGVSVGDDNPAKLCAQDMAYTASSAVALDMVVLAKCCKYKAIWCATAGILGSLWLLTHSFQCLNALRYLDVVLFPRLFITLTGSSSTRLFSSGSSNSLRIFHSLLSSTSQHIYRDN